MNADVWEAIPDALEKDGVVVVATIAARDGSAPRGVGTKMLIHRDGRLTGTLGGGLGEARAVREGMLVLADGVSRMLAVDMTGSAMDGADLICGGRVEISLQRLEPESLDEYRALRDRMREGKTRLVLAGGGHVSLATARMAVRVGFGVTVIDDREEFANPGRFPWLEPGRALVVDGFRNCLSGDVLGFPVDAGCFVAILTRGHSFDREVLAQALRTDAGYVGMIGSRRKRDALYAGLLAEGFTQTALDRVHSPIGLAIGAETPEEIAVSIVAQLIAARAKYTKEKHKDFMSPQSGIPPQTPE